jgi:hypothetical protein
MKKRMSIAFALLVHSGMYASFTNHSFMTYRSQGQNLARNVAGWQSLRTDVYNGDAQGNVSIAVEYDQAFNTGAINKYFFGSDCMTFSGSLAPYRGECDIMADYFGLPTDFQSVVSFAPQMHNVIFDFDFYWNLDCLIKGFNLRFYLPVAYTRWALNPCETVINPGTLSYPAGYMSTGIIDVADLKKGALDVLSHCQTFGDLVHPIQYGRLDACPQHATKVADILVALGYTFVRHRAGLIGINLQAIIPTGTFSHARTLFEPQIGNGHHWALGGGITARYDIIDNDTHDLKLSACLDASIQHLFKATEVRSYDLTNNGPGSRYMLLENMGAGISNAIGFSTTPLVDIAVNEYLTQLSYVIDATTLDSKIKINVQGDVVAKLTLDYRNWNFDLGYNFWGRSHETLVSRTCMNHKYYGIKGDAQVYGFLSPAMDIFLDIPANATQSNATLHAGQGVGNTNNNFVNINADNAGLLYDVGFIPIQQTTPDSLSGTGAIEIDQINGSNQAIVLTDADINNCSGLSARAYTNKVFGSAAYTWADCKHVKPYVSLGAEGEFAGSEDCVKTAISQWGVWVKGGFNY